MGCLPFFVCFLGKEVETGGPAAIRGGQRGSALCLV